jgi:hypothetical protein
MLMKKEKTVRMPAAPMNRTATELDKGAKAGGPRFCKNQNFGVIISFPYIPMSGQGFSRPILFQPPCLRELSI